MYLLGSSLDARRRRGRCAEVHVEYDSTFLRFFRPPSPASAQGRRIRARPVARVPAAPTQFFSENFSGERVGPAANPNGARVTLNGSSVTLMAPKSRKY